MEAKRKVTLERIGIWAGILIPGGVSLMWLGALDSRVNAADASATEATSTAQTVATKIAALDERTVAIQRALDEIKVQQTAQAQAAADAQKEIIKALRDRR